MSASLRSGMLEERLTETLVQGHPVDCRELAKRLRHPWLGIAVTGALLALFTLRDTAKTEPLVAAPEPVSVGGDHGRAGPRSLRLFDQGVVLAQPVSGACGWSPLHGRDDFAAVHLEIDVSCN